MNLEKEMYKNYLGSRGEQFGGKEIMFIEDAVRIAKRYAKANRLEPEVDVKTAELKEALQDATLHFTQRTFSIRPCETCDLVSEIIKKPFGCKDLRKINDSRFSD